jgi:uncharacterized membrane protein
MEIFLLIIVLVFLIFIARHLAVILKKLKNLEENYIDFQRQLNRIPHQTSEKPAEKAAPATTAPVLLKPENEKKLKEWTPFETSLAGEQTNIPKSESPAPVPDFADASHLRGAQPSTQGWFEKWLHDNPDIEKFIGENLINKIGISVLVLGIAFFVKYAIDQEWINKVGRVCIGLFCGVILNWFANRLRKSYHAFSSVLVGGDITIFYFTIAFAFHQYHLISQEAAFGIMVVITVFAVLLSILYDRIELGILAAVGGFITPFLVSRGDGNWLVLFTYLSILDAGLIVLAYYKRWRVINFIAFFFTEIIYLGWIVSRSSGTIEFPFVGCLLFGTAFYLMFVIMNVIHHVIRGSKLKAFDFIILLSVNLAYYGAGLYLLQESGSGRYKGLFTASLGIINLFLAYLFFRNSKADKKFIYLLIGITLSFISLTAPVQLKGHYITMFWAAEMVVILWLYQKSFIKVLKISVLLISSLMLVSLVMDWTQVYTQDQIIYPIIFNKGCVTGFFSSLCTFLVWLLMRREADTYFIRGITNNLLRNIYLVASVLLIFCTGAFEINDQFSKRLPGTGMQFVYLQLYLVIFALVLTSLLTNYLVKLNKYLLLTIPLLVFCIYVLNIENSLVTEIRVLEKGQYRSFFPAAWISALGLILLIWNTIRNIRKNKTAFLWILPYLTASIAVAIVITFSVEIRSLFIWINFARPDSIRIYGSMFDKAGLSIVWGSSSFIMIWLGMKHRYKPLRIVALIVFGITLIKLFTFDIRDIAPAGKIIAFILLGVLLLIISFMYQRLKKIIIDDQKIPE